MLAPKEDIEENIESQGLVAAGSSFGYFPRHFFLQLFFPYPPTVLTTCHQKVAATAERMASSGRYQDTPKLRPVQPMAAQAASRAPGLRMARHWPPSQLQFHPLP